MVELEGSRQILVPEIDAIFGKSGIKPGSLIAMAPSANRVFGLLGDDVSIDSVVSIFRNPVSGVVVGVRLSDLWIDVDATPKQLRLANKALSALLFSSEPPDTMGKLRGLVEEKIEISVVGVYNNSKNFLKAAFRKTEESGGEITAPQLIVDNLFT